MALKIVKKALFCRLNHKSTHSILDEMDYIFKSFDVGYHPSTYMDPQRVEHDQWACHLKGIQVGSAEKRVFGGDMSYIVRYELVFYVCKFIIQKFQDRYPGLSIGIDRKNRVFGNANKQTPLLFKLTRI